MTRVTKQTAAGEFAIDNRSAAEVLALLKGSSGIELKVMLPCENRAILRHLGFDPVDAEPRQTYFFDTPDFDLNKAGLFVRARRGPRGFGDTTVKLRPVEPGKIDRKLVRNADFKVELDVMNGGYVCSASVRGECTADEVYDASEGRIQLESIFSDQQHRYFNDNAPQGIGMKDLAPIGPVFQLQLNYVPKGFHRSMAVELWLYPDGTRILELSTKGRPDEAYQLGAQFRTFLGEAKLMRAVDATTNIAQTLKILIPHGQGSGLPQVV